MTSDTRTGRLMRPLGRRIFLAGVAALPLAGAVGAVAAAPISGTAITMMAINGRVVPDSNPALMAARLLCDQFGADFSAGFDLDALIAAIDACDAPVAMLDGGTEPRYSVQGPLPAFKNPTDELVVLLGFMNGRVVWNGERWFIFAGAE